MPFQSFAFMDVVILVYERKPVTTYDVLKEWSESIIPWLVLSVFNAIEDISFVSQGV